MILPESEENDEQNGKRKPPKRRLDRKDKKASEFCHHKQPTNLPWSLHHTFFQDKSALFKKSIYEAPVEASMKGKKKGSKSKEITGSKETSVMMDMPGAPPQGKRSSGSSALPTVSWNYRETQKGLVFNLLLYSQRRCSSLRRERRPRVRLAIL